MKKKSILWTYIKRTLLIVIGVLVLTIVSVYFLDVYKAADADFDNKYEDSYWENIEANGFIGYEEINEQMEADLKTIDCNSATYKVPYSISATDVEKVNSARYLEELEKIYNSVTNKTALVNEAYNAKKTELNGYSYFEFYPDYKKDNYEYKEVLNNGKYRLLFNMLETTFVLEELDAAGNTVNTWTSNPTSKDSAMEAQQSSLMNVTFISGDKTAIISPTTYSTYTHSTYEDENSKVVPNYYVNLVEDEQGKGKTLQVYYVMEERGINYTWFPEYITEERLIELIERCNKSVAEYAAANNGAYELDSDENEITGLGYKSDINSCSPAAKALYGYVINAATGYGKDDKFTAAYGSDVYCLTKYKYISAITMSQIYRFLYEWCDYTSEDLEKDLKTQYDIETKLGYKEEEKVNTSVDTLGKSPRVELAIEYALNENGLSVVIPGNSVKTNTNDGGYNYEVTTIDLLPYFTSVKRSENAEGYAVIPDGSGAILEFDNDKANYPSYNKRIYSSDVTFTSYILTTSTTDILLPMYAYVFTGDDNHTPKAMVVEALSGAAQVSLKADTSNRGSNSFNWAYYSIAYRESQRIAVGTSINNRVIRNQYTKNAVTCDYTFNYMCLDTNEYEANYTGVAKFYRNLLIERSKDEQGVAALSTNNDTTDNLVLDLTVLGSYTFHDNFLGIGYTNKDSLTTTEQLQTMIDEVLGLKEQNEKMNLNIYYMGWREDGLKDVSFEKIKVSKEIGGKKKLLDLLNNTAENVTIYPYVEFMEYQGYQESFGKNHYTARDVSGAYSVKYPYELHSNVFNKELDQVMALSPEYYTAFASKLAKNYQKVLGTDVIAINGLGSTLSGNYRKNKEMFKVNAVVEQIKSFEILKASGIEKIAVEAPYAYAFDYVSSAYNVPYQATQYEILDYTVPLYHLVVNGLFDYTGESINANIEKGTTEQLMRCIETGSNLSFTFTYDDSAELIQTNYNNYYYTYYSRWLEDVKKCYDELTKLGIYDCELVAHERLDNNVYRVTYTNETGKTVNIILNYQRTTWNMPGTTLRVSAKSYHVE